MAITQVDIDSAEDLINELLGNQDAAEEYSKDPEGWLQDNGYGNVSPEAVQQCAVTHRSRVVPQGERVASPTRTPRRRRRRPVRRGRGRARPGRLQPLLHVDNSVDNSITNNIVNNGNLDFDQTVQQGDGNVAIDGDVTDSQVQTGRASRPVTTSTSTTPTSRPVTTTSRPSTRASNVETASCNVSEHRAPTPMPGPRSTSTPTSTATTSTRDRRQLIGTRRRRPGPPTSTRSASPAPTVRA